MERDISNTFIHNLIEERIHDLSNNPQAQFLGMLVNMLNGNSNFNSNLAMLPLANNFVNTQISQGSNLNRILNDSLLMEKTPYKKILKTIKNKTDYTYLFKMLTYNILDKYYLAHDSFYTKRRYR